jgi:Mn2+/Fe2+ NRAMP family transporter
LVKANDNDSIRSAPKSLGGTLKELGPGLIVAGAVVGSGELIATTLTGAEAGFWLLWLILLGCMVKVFAQLELGRYSLATGKTTLEGLSQLPGPSLAGIHWIVWLWLVMFVSTVGQAGGIVGAVGQAISISAPLTQEGKAFNDAANEKVKRQIAHVIKTTSRAPGQVAAPEKIVAAGEVASAPQLSSGLDAYYWALAITIITSALLYFGRYNLIEKVAMALVAGFTAISLANLFLLQQSEVWAVRAADIAQGLSGRLPPPRPGLYPIATALATFGIIGMAAGELIFYPYWCLEKGYGRYVGPPADTPEWNQRAAGWNRVMRWDAWCSMAVYTLSTVIFYLLGAAVLRRADLRPQGMDLIRTLSAMYEPVFGSMAVGLFLVGSVAVLYSTFLVSSASNAMVFADALDIFTRKRKVRLSKHQLRPILGLALPLIAFVLFVFYPKPKYLILLAGATQTLMLPVLAFSALYFRYKHTSPALRPSKLWDALLWLSAVVLLVVGLWLAVQLMGLVEL